MTKKYKGSDMVKGESIVEILAKIKNSEITKEEGYSLIKSLKEAQNSSEIIINPLKNEHSKSMLLEAVETDLCQLLHELINVDIKDLDPMEEIKEYGLDAILQVSLIENINEKFNINCSDVIFYKLNPQNLHELSKHLINENELVLYKYYDFADVINISSEQSSISGGQSSVNSEQSGISGELSGVLSEQSGISVGQNGVNSEQSGIFDEQNDISDGIIEVLSNVLKMDASEFDMDEDVREYGIDSILQVKVVEEINKKYSINCTPTIFFELEDSSLKGFISYLKENFEIKSETVSNVKKMPDVESVTNNELQYFEGKTSFNGNNDEQISDNIAVIGVSIRVPNARNKDEFWDNLINNVDCISDIPLSIKNESNLQDGKVKKAGFIDDVDKFDAELFHISAREAVYMDPQQRLMLESVWEVFEDAGYRISDFNGKRTGVFLAAATHDYADLMKMYDPNTCEAHISTGISNAMIANRVSYLFNFNGPSEVIDTACSGSLVSLHRAIQSLQLGESEIAIAGGVNLNLSMATFDIFETAGLLSEDSKCKTLDDSANGYVRGEGVATVLLKPLNKAISDGDHIYGIIRGSAVNHGGKANSLTAPNVNAQADVIMRAFHNGKVDASSIDYVELHGTGTSLGDPIEIKGLTKAFSQMYQKANKSYQPNTCGIGSVKTNIGHLESVAGIVGVIKILLSMQNKVLPALIHYKKLNQFISLDETPFYVVDKNQSWEGKTDKDGKQNPRRACVSSFGFGGTNAHVIVEEYISPNIEVVMENDEDNIICLSSTNMNQLECTVKNLIQFINKNGLTSIRDISYTLCVGRELMSTRLAVIAKDKYELVSALKKWLTDKKETDRLYFGESDRNVVIENKDIHDIKGAAKAYIAGSKFDYKSLYKKKGNLISLPGYSFRKESFWLNVIPRREENVHCCSAQEGKAKSLEIKHSRNPIMCEYVNNKVQLFSLNEKQEESVSIEKYHVEESIKHDTKGTEETDMFKENTRMYTQQNESLMEKIKGILADILFCEISKINVNSNFVDLGLDSILCVEFVKALNKNLNINLSTVTIYDYSTVEKLTQYILDSTVKEDANKEDVNNEKSFEESLITINKESGNDNNFSSGEDRFSKDEIKKILADILFTDVSKIEENTPFQELGLDSILCVEFVKKLNSEYNTNITTTMIYDNVCVQSLTKAMNEQCHSKQTVVRDIVAQETTVVNTEKEDTVKVEERIEESTPVSDEEIAIIGIALRTSGAENKDEFWTNIRNGVCSVTEIPSERWNADEYFDADSTQEGKMYCKWGAFLKDADKFDAEFFGISPAEAKNLDPNQRILIEEIWKSLEDAGYSMKQLDGMRCSIYTGMSTGGEYPVKSLMNNHSISSARMSYFLNLKGEALSLDTACSSSMVALNLACRSLREGFCEMAVAAGVSLFLNPEVYIHMCKAGMLSHIGKCSAFDDSADGFIPGEGVASVVVKRLSQAIKDNDHIYGVIKGIAVNQDGKTNGITAPSALSQAELEEYVYTKANVNPETIDYIECHGTGTKLGDPIEIMGLTDAFSKFTKKKQFCDIGSVKTNVGHTACAAGLVGLIKVLMAMDKGEIPPSIHYTKENEHIDFSKTPFRVNSSLKKWNCNHTKRAAISSFGMSGTNAHVLVEEYREVQTKKQSLNQYIIPISSRKDELLVQKITSLREWILQNDVDLGELSYNLSCCRTHFNKRVCCVVTTKDELLVKLGESLEALRRKYEIFDDLSLNEKVCSIKEITNVYGTDKVKDYLKNIANRYIQGEDIDWEFVFEGNKTKRISIPGYVFEKRSFPIYRTLNDINMTMTSVKGSREINYIIDGNEPMLQDNVAYGSKVLSTMSYLEYVRKAISKEYNKNIVCIDDLRAYEPLWIDQQQKIKIILEEKNDSYLFRVYSVDGNILHLKGKAYTNKTLETKLNIDELKKEHGIRISGEEIFSRYAKMNHHYGKSMQSLSELYFCQDESSFLAKIDIPSCIKETVGKYYFHPALLEGVVQAIGAKSAYSNNGITGKLMSFGFESYAQLDRLPESFYVYCRNNSVSEHEDVIRESGLLIDDNGNVLGELKDFMVYKVKSHTDNKIEGINVQDKFYSEVYSLIQELLEIDTLDETKDISFYGFSSLSLIDLVSKINQKYSIKVEVDLLMDIDELTSEKIAEKLYKTFGKDIESFYVGALDILNMTGDLARREKQEVVPMTLFEQEKISDNRVAIIGLKEVSKSEIIKKFKFMSSDLNSEQDITDTLLFDIISGLLDDAAYTKDVIRNKEIGVVFAKSDLMNSNIVDCKGNAIKNVAHKISDYFEVYGVSEDIINCNNSCLVAFSKAVDFVKFKGCETCICVGYSCDGIYAAMLKLYTNALRDRDHIYCLTEFSRYGYRLNDSKLKEEIEKLNNNETVNVNVKQYTGDLDAISYGCSQGPIEEHNELVSFSVDTMKENCIYKIIHGSNETTTVFNLLNDDERMLLVLKSYQHSRIESNNNKIIVLSSENELSFDEYVSKMIGFIESKAVMSEQITSVFPQFDKDVYKLIQKNIKTDEGKYIKDSITNMLENVNQVFHLDLNEQDFLNAPSVGQFIRFIYQSNKQKIKEYYMEAQKREAQEFDFSLDDMAYTLQVGRESLEYRMAIIASTPKELLEKLIAVKAKKEVASVYINDIHKNNIGIYNVFEDTDGKKIMEYIANSNNLEKLANIWSLGVDIDWSILLKDSKATRIPLPSQRI